MEIIVRFAVYALLAYGLLVGVMYVFQRSLMYFPDKTAIQPARAGVPEMTVRTLTTEDGIELVTWYRPATVGRSTIVCFHGNGGHIADRAFRIRPFLDAGYGVLLVSYRGYGGSGGSPTEAGLYADGRAALAFLEAEGVRSDHVVLFGESLGAAIAIHVAGEAPVGAIVLEAPFTSAVDEGRAAYPFLPVAWLLKDRYLSIDKIAAIEAPLLIVHGEADRTVPVTHGRRLLEAATPPKQGMFLPGAGHNDLPAHGSSEAALEFLDGVFRGEGN